MSVLRHILTSRTIWLLHSFCFFGRRFFFISSILLAALQFTVCQSVRCCVRLVVSMSAWLGMNESANAKKPGDCMNVPPFMVWVMFDAMRPFICLFVRPSVCPSTCWSENCVRLCWCFGGSPFMVVLFRISSLMVCLSSLRRFLFLHFPSPFLRKGCSNCVIVLTDFNAHSLIRWDVV